MRSERRVASLPFVRSRTLYLDDNAKLKMDIKGLVFKKPRGGACSTIERDDADIVVIITRRGKGTERFARRVGLLCPKTFKHYVEACVGVAVTVHSKGDRARTDAYTAGRLL